MSSQQGSYYLPEPSHWPLVGSVGIFSMFVGAANWLHGHAFGPYLFVFGVFVVMFMISGWFRVVIGEDQAGLLKSTQVNHSFRWGMIWFIFSEVMFFAAFFGALFYARSYSVPWLGGEGSGTLTHLLLWPNFQSTWPVFHNPDSSQFSGPNNVMDAWGVPALNTLVLLTSGLTITIAHWGILNNNRKQAIIGQALTIILGISFLILQFREYGAAYSELGLRLDSGIYGTTFFMLTGFHGLHVTIGTIMLCIMLYRIVKGHFSAEHHFAFEAVSWYWHFVDVVWLVLFIFVYWI